MLELWLQILQKSLPGWKIPWELCFGEAMGRGANASPRRQLLWLPDGKGRLSIIDQSDGVKNSSRLIRAENKKVFSELTEPALRAS